MTRSRSFTGTVTAAVLVVAFGNQWVTDWIRDTFPDTSAPLSWFMHQLTWPSWSVDFSGSDAELRLVVARDVRAVLTVGLVYVLLVAFRKTFPEGFSGFVLGWATLIFASAVAAFAAAFAVSNPTVIGALSGAALASVYGLFVGWIVGFVVSVGRNIPILRGSSEKSSTAA